MQSTTLKCTNRFKPYRYCIGLIFSNLKSLSNSILKIKYDVVVSSYRDWLQKAVRSTGFAAEFYPIAAIPPSAAGSKPFLADIGRTKDASFLNRGIRICRY